MTLSSSTAAGSPNIEADDTLLPAAKSANPTSGTPFVLKATDGGLFSFYSIELDNPLAGTAPITLVGTTATGGNVTQTFDVSSGGGLQTFNLPETFANLTSVSFDPGSLIIADLAATETLKPGVNVQVASTIPGTMPNAPESIVINTGNPHAPYAIGTPPSITVNGVNVTEANAPAYYNSSTIESVRFRVHFNGC